jgi:hypothetical protein
MSSNCTCRALIVSGGLLLASPALADVVSIAKRPYLELTAENQAADLELGLAFDLPSKLTIRPYVRVPFSDGDERLIRVDKHSSAIKGGLGLEKEVSLEEEAGKARSRSLRFVVEAELGTKVFEYEPFGATMTSEERHQVFAASLEARYVHLDRAVQFAPQLAVTYARSYEAASAIGIVVPGMNGDPDTVKTAVVDPPTVTPTLVVRVGTPFYPTWQVPLAFGVYGVGEFTGSKYDPSGEGQLVRAELWTYLFPKSPANSRAGVALFAESERAVSGGARETEYGLFVQLKLNTTLLEY